MDVSVTRCSKMEDMSSAIAVVVLVVHMYFGIQENGVYSFLNATTLLMHRYPESMFFQPIYRYMYAT